MSELSKLPQGLPEPEDDGACDHLLDCSLPELSLLSTQGAMVNISKAKNYLVLYCYPMTGKPGVALPQGWDQIPGARGCTPQSCAFRDHYQDLTALRAEVYGISTQASDEQVEAKKRLHLPFELLSDVNLELAQALQLPIFEVDNKYLLKRVTIIVKNNEIVKVFYPVFPPNANADEVIAWLKAQ
ncbi:peroxiredoxin [[Limnothrix rosea] IAM M-220]|uniref:peroxiredoxin n=1 Tax=[Limnothrix rosea] IAM M-220 TaxID=454133 RepID=UPI0009611DE9|nr:peroxiredoxin [[Limnothrix rosea] IAM M-220]OKH16903.1 peroxiredoxin [[Limnothrix rosea] IAM M-220]